MFGDRPGIFKLDKRTAAAVPTEHRVGHDDIGASNAASVLIQSGGLVLLHADSGRLVGHAHLMRKGVMRLPLGAGQGS